MKGESEVGRISVPNKGMDWDSRRGGGVFNGPQPQDIVASFGNRYYSSTKW
jgi:hypothetical protein